MHDQNAQSAGIPTLPDPQTARRLGARLRELGISTGGLVRHFGARDEAQLAAMPDSMKVARLTEPTPINAAIRLLVRGSACDEAAVRLALPDMPTDQLESQGIIRRVDGQIFGAFLIFVVGDVLVAADAPRLWPQRPLDFVSGVAGSTRFMGDMMLRKSFGEGLQLGGEHGYLSVIASRSCENVTAVESSPRAAAYARMNAALNDRSNVTIIDGSGIDAIADRTFDFVFLEADSVELEPDASVDAVGGPTEERWRNLVRASSELLNPGGSLQVLFDLPLRAGEDPRAVLASWFDGLSSDVLLYRIRSMDAKGYLLESVRQRATERGIQSAEQIDAMIRRAGERQQAQRIGGVATMFATLRRRDEWEAAADRKPWVLAEEGSDKLLSPMSDHIIRVFANMDFLVGASEQKIASTRFRAAPDVRLRQEMALSEQGSWQTSENTIRLASGFGRGAPAPSALTGIVAMCDGTRTASQIVEQLAQGTRQTVQQIAPQTLAALRGLLERGIITPVG